MTAERCENCKYWHEEFKRDGLCRRYPPNLFVRETYISPKTSSAYWCGEWKAKDKQEGEGK